MSQDSIHTYVDGNVEKIVNIYKPEGAINITINTNDISSIEKLLKDLPVTTTIKTVKPEINIPVKSLQDSTLITKLKSELFKNLNELIEKNDTDVAINKIDDFLNGTDCVDEEFKVDLLAIKGIIYVKIGKDLLAKEILEVLENLICETKRKNIFLLNYAAVSRNEEMKDVALEKLSILGSSDRELKLNNAFYYTAIGDYKKVLTLLGK